MTHGQFFDRLQKEMISEDSFVEVVAQSIIDGTAGRPPDETWLNKEISDAEKAELLEVVEDTATTWVDLNSDEFSQPSHYQKAEKIIAKAKEILV